MTDNISTLSQLGSGSTIYEYEGKNTSILETFENKFPNRLYLDIFEFNEFTSLCPKTGQPDFAKIKIIYVPDKLCIESKSLKLYFFSFRNEGAFMETIVNMILDDIVVTCRPHYAQVIGDFNARGGIVIKPIVEYFKEGVDKAEIMRMLTVV